MNKFPSPFAVGISLMLVLAVACGLRNKTAVPVSETTGDMYFSSEYVMETFWYSPGAYYVTYDDPDAEMDYEVIRVDSCSYFIINNAVDEGRKITGTLTASDGEIHTLTLD